MIDVDRKDGHTIINKLTCRGFDDEMRAIVASNLEGRGIKLHPGTNLSELSKTADGIKVVTDKGEELIADVVLFATGRTPNSQRLNLQAAGVEIDRVGAIKVDEYSRTSAPSVWAVGDVTNRINLTPVALMEATCFAKTVFGGQQVKPDHRDVPCAVFSLVTQSYSLSVEWCCLHLSNPAKLHGCTYALQFAAQ